MQRRELLRLQRGVGARGETQRPLVLGDRLAVGAERGGPAGGGQGMAQHGRAVARGLSVERHPRGVLTAQAGQRGEYAGVEATAAVRGDALLNCQPGHLVAEPRARAVLR